MSSNASQGTRWVSLKIPLTCGEWVQGRLNGSDFLVSCPINMFTELTISCSRTGDEEIDVEATRINHKGDWEYPKKAVMAVKNICEDLGFKGFKFMIKINCPIPPEKGFATSSADVFGSIMAVQKLFDLELSAERFFKSGVEIEPSDSIGYPGLWKINHRVKPVFNSKSFSPAPKYLGRGVNGKVMVLDLGGKVDTRKFNNNKSLNKLYDETSETALKAYNLVKKGVKNNNLNLMARGATLSAKAHQKILPKQELDFFINRLDELESLGVVVAHSGTLVGLIYPPEKDDLNWFYPWNNAKGTGSIIGVFQLRGGGVEWTGGGIIEAS